jgi:hypothetical protein
VPVESSRHHVALTPSCNVVVNSLRERVRTVGFLVLYLLGYANSFVADIIILLCRMFCSKAVCLAGWVIARLSGIPRNSCALYNPNRPKECCRNSVDIL